MALSILDPRTEPSVRSTSSYTDNVIPHLAEWTAMGKRCALVTLVGIEGTAPRALGAQMAVSESGQWAGYISGGCLEQAIALEAVEAIKAGKHRLIRYGKGSPYFDIRLPCGSGLDVLIQPSLDKHLIGEMEQRIGKREPFSLFIDIAEGGAFIKPAQDHAPATMQSHRDGDRFIRSYTPPLRCIVIGTSPIAISLAELAAASGFVTIFHTSDLDAVPPLPPAVSMRSFAPPYAFATDPWTAAILAFHDHEQEMPALSRLLASACFFIAAIGSRSAHEVRVLALRETRVKDSDIARIKSPAGLIPGLKSAPHVALSILAEVVAAAREQRLLA